MQLVIVSDTHGHHERLGRLSGDVLVHCGDGAGRSDESVEALDDWFAEQDFAEILAIGGNHDRAVERRVREGRPVFRHARYLQDEAFVFRGVVFYGAPWVPELAGSAFHQRPRQIRQRWGAIPGTVDVLITHTPPAGMLDQNRRGRSCGCPELRDAVCARDVLLHCFGHIHASAGWRDIGFTRFVNASVLRRHGPLNAPTTVRLDDLRRPGRGRVTALHQAAARGDLAGVRQLLDAGAGASVPRRNAFAPLHAAAMHGHDQVVATLLCAGADPTVQTYPQGYSPLHSAAFANHARTCELLLLAGAPRTLRNHRGETPAQTAARRGHLPLAARLAGPP